VSVWIDAHSIWSDRIDRIRERAKAQLSSLELPEKQQRLLTRRTLTLITDTKAKISDRARSADQYTRPMPRTLWSEKFDENKSAINLPITGQLLRVFAKKLGAPKPWSAGYLMALAMLDLFDQLSRADVTESKGYRGIDSQTEYDEEMYAFTESMLGKAEEAIYKADVLSEHARYGKISQRAANKNWEPRVEVELKKMGRAIDKFRFQSGNKAGRIKKTPLSDRLCTIINSDEPPPKFPTEPKTIERRLPEILARINIRDK